MTLLTRGVYRIKQDQYHHLAELAQNAAHAGKTAEYVRYDVQGTLKLDNLSGLLTVFTSRKFNLDIEVKVNTAPPAGTEQAAVGHKEGQRLRRPPSTLTIRTPKRGSEHGEKKETR